MVHFVCWGVARKKPLLSKGELGQCHKWPKVHCEGNKTKWDTKVLKGIRKPICPKKLFPGLVRVWPRGSGHTQLEDSSKHTKKLTVSVRKVYTTKYKTAHITSLSHVSRQQAESGGKLRNKGNSIVLSWSVFSSLFVLPFIKVVLCSIKLLVMVSMSHKKVVKEHIYLIYPEIMMENN